MTPRPVRVVLADDHPTFRFGLRAILADATEVEVVGEASDGQQLIEVVDRMLPAVVLTDLTMPTMDGTSAARHIRQRHPEIGVIVLTMHEDDQTLFSALRAGARGYLLKNAEPAEIIRGVLAVAAGDVIYGGPIAQRVVDFFVGAQQKYAAQVFPGLTVREREVLTVLAQGCGNHEIARRLLMSEKTVRNHVATILAKLQAPNRAAAVSMARDAGIGGSSS